MPVPRASGTGPGDVPPAPCRRRQGEPPEPRVECWIPVRVLIVAPVHQQMPRTGQPTRLVTISRTAPTPSPRTVAEIVGVKVRAGQTLVKGPATVVGIASRPDPTPRASHSRREGTSVGQSGGPGSGSPAEAGGPTPEDRAWRATKMAAAPRTVMAATICAVGIPNRRQLSALRDSTAKR